MSKYHHNEYKIAYKELFGQRLVKSCPEISLHGEPTVLSSGLTASVCRQVSMKQP